MLRVLGLLGLVLALVIVALLVKRQLGGAVTAPSPAATSQQIQQQVKQSLDAAMQAPRAVPDE